MKLLTALALVSLVSLAPAAAPPGEPEPELIETIDYAWMMLAPDGMTLIAGKKLVVGSSYGGCYIRAIQQGDQVLDWSCPGSLACGDGCAENEREFDDYTLIWCGCPSVVAR